MLSRHPREDSVATRMDSFLAWCIFPGIFTGDGSSNIYVPTKIRWKIQYGKKKFFDSWNILVYVFFFFVRE